MSQILVVSLGTSPEPIINCINSLRPERVVFLCSVETQKLVDQIRAKVTAIDFQPERDVVVLQQRLNAKESDEVINELDQLDRIYLRALDLFAAIRKQQPGCQITADYTGGTKTMTTGLAMAAVDDGNVKLNLTISNRTAGQTAITGYSAPVAVSTAAIQARRLQDRELPGLLARFDYEAARQAVRRVMDLADQDPQTGRWLKGLHDRLVALDAWDRFDHRRAVDVLEGFRDTSLLLPLKRVIGSRCLLDQEAQDWPQMRGHGFEAVEDLLRNAERRAAQDRYDDAVGRLYRAMELNEQLLLKVGVCEQVGPEGINTSALALECLPASIQVRWREKAERKGIKEPIKIGLCDAYDLLADLKHPTGLAWQERRPALVDSLQIRNNSLFAHGFQAVDASRWRALWGTLGGFLSQALAEQQQGKGQSAAASLAQLPRSLEQLLPCTQFMAAASSA